jgi:hypothetical protein
MDTINIDNKLVIDSYGKLEDVMQHLTYNIKTKIAVSTIHGIGVIAIRDIKKGEHVFPIWEHDTGIYVIPNDRLNEIPNEVLELLDMYFINEECGYKIIRLFSGLNFLSNAYSYCNSAYNTEYTQNITNDGIALRDIKAGDEILEWYFENIK